jgi:hypothetical protein
MTSSVLRKIEIVSDETEASNHDLPKVKLADNREPGDCGLPKTEKDNGQKTNANRVRSSNFSKAKRRDRVLRDRTRVESASAEARRNLEKKDSSHVSRPKNFDRRNRFGRSHQYCTVIPWVKGN